MQCILYKCTSDRLLCLHIHCPGHKASVLAPCVRHGSTRKGGTQGTSDTTDCAIHLLTATTSMVGGCHFHGFCQIPRPVGADLDVAACIHGRHHQASITITATLDLFSTHDLFLHCDGCHLKALSDEVPFGCSGPACGRLPGPRPAAHRR